MSLPPPTPHEKLVIAAVLGYRIQKEFEEKQELTPAIRWWISELQSLDLAELCESTPVCGVKKGFNPSTYS